MKQKQTNSMVWVHEAHNIKLNVLRMVTVTLKKEHRLKVFETRVLRRIFGSKMNEVLGRWRKLHNEIHILCTLPGIIRMIKARRMKWSGHPARTG
jgi:hypothetical protein